MYCFKLHLVTSFFLNKCDDDDDDPMSRRGAGCVSQPIVASWIRSSAIVNKLDTANRTRLQ